MAVDSGTYTDDTLHRRRKIAEAMLTGDKPIRHWAEGVAEVGKGLIGGYQLSKADEMERAKEDAANAQLFAAAGLPAPASAPRESQGGFQKLAALMSGGGADAPASPAASAAMPSAPMSAPPAAPSQPGKIYSNDEPSPLDPPSGQDRSRMIATILGESANQPAAGQNAVASVIRNRAVAGNYGGDTPSGVVTAKNQFEPWNTEGGRSKMATMMTNPALAAKADQAIALAYGEGGQAPNDPTNGAKNFIEPKLQTALGRPMPAWAQGPGQMIGDHKFIGGAPQDPAQQPYQVAGPPTGAPQAPVAQAMTPPQMPSAPTGMFANVPKEQLPGILSGLTSKNPTLKAIAVQQLGNYTKAAAPTDEMREYNLDTAQRKARGEAPLSFFDFKSGIKKAGATNVTTNVDQGENSFAKEAGKSQAQRFDELAQGGQQAKQMVSDIDTLTELGKGIGTGKGAELKGKIGPYAEALGIKIEGLSDIQAYEAIVNRVAPSLRVKGSGAQSDLELKNFLKSLPSLGNTPEGNALAAATIKGLQENKVLAAEIASKALNGEITRPEADKQLRNLPDPMTNYRDFMKNRKAPAPAETSAPDRSAVEAEMKRRGLLK